MCAPDGRRRITHGFDEEQLVDLGVRQQLAWHALHSNDVLAELSTSMRGLSDGEVTRRRLELGPNLLTRVSHETPVTVVARQLKNPLSLVMLGAGILAYSLASTTDAIVIFFIVAVNTAIGGIQELRAARAIAALESLVPEYSTTFRNGETVQVAAPDLVPGDIVLLQAGARVPADIRIVHATNAQASEQALTGEPVPIPKQVEPVPADAPLAERSSMLYAGTVLASGAATGVIVATGSMTELGRISMMLAAAGPPETPLVQALKQIGKRLTKIIGAVAAVVVGIAYFRGFPPFEAVRAGVSLACASVPVALPAAMTVTLAVAVRRMAARHAIIRALPSIETLGSTSVICSDKTGTLTVGEMTVRRLWSAGQLYELTGVGYVPTGELVRHGESVELVPEHVIEPVTFAGVLCNDAVVKQRGAEWVGIGSMTDVALVIAAMKLGIDVEAARARRRRLDLIPFDSRARRMVTLDEVEDGRRIMIVKGAPEVVLQDCDPQTFDRRAITELVDLLAASGMRVIAVATRDYPPSEDTLTPDATKNSTFKGLFGLVDPPRPEAVTAIAMCHAAGIQVKMVTGDHPTTARAISAELGITGADDRVLTGADLDKLDDTELWTVAERIHLYARVEPGHKLRLVQALQRRGKVVAMTGDGVNDAPALRQADVGIAMGRRGTAAARDAADVILVDDNFASIAAAVEEGRRCFENLMKLLSHIVPTAVGQGLIVFIGVLFFPIVNGTPLMPMLPLQVMWVNFVTGGTLALPLAWERADPDLMQRPPRVRDQPIFNRYLVERCLLVGFLITAGGVGLFLWQYDDARPFLEPPADPVFALRKAQTMAVTTVVMFQVFYLFQCRSLTTSALRVDPFSNLTIYSGVLVTVAMQVAFVHSSLMNRAFNSEPLDLDEWVLSICVAAAVLPIVSLHKRRVAKATSMERSESSTT